MKDVHVVGAGISGLATAWFLSQRGARVVVSEEAPEPGGLIRTIRRPEGLIETAARAFTRTPRVDQLLRDLNLPVITPPRQARRRYVLRGSRPRRWPLTAVESARAAARLARTWAERDLPPRDDDTVEEWGERVAGRAALDWVIAPALQGIYAVSASRLSARAVFRARAGRGDLVAPANGMGELVTRLHDALRERGVTFEFNSPAKTITPGAPTAICTDSAAAASLLSREAPRVASALTRIQVTTLRTVTAFFQPHHEDLRGFGVLFPRSGDVRALGVVFNTDIFPNRSEHRSETWIYEGSGLRDCRDVVDAMTFDRSVFTSRTDAPIGECLVPPIAEVPVYDMAVARAIDLVNANGLPRNIALAGNYLGRLGVSKLVDGAAEAADRLMTR